MPLDANGQALVYVYARETREQADIAKVLIFDEARRIAVNVAELPKLLAALGGPQVKRPAFGSEAMRQTDGRL